ncbi:MAG TPA: cytochrome P450 [Abditibacteriaceae bacterium]
MTDLSLAKDYRAIPGPKGLPFFGVLNARPDTLNFYRNMHSEFGELTRYEAFKKFEWYFVAHPDDIEQVMLGSTDVYYKGIGWNRVRMVLGDGLLVSEAGLHRHQRRIMLPAFNRSHHESYAQTMIEVIDETIAVWRLKAQCGETFDMAEAMMRLALMNVGRAMFGSDMRHIAGPMGRALHTILYWVHLRAVSLESWRGKKQFQSALADLHGLIDCLIAQRRAQQREGQSFDDVLDLLLKARDEETGEPLSDALVRDEMVTMIVAGHETAAVGLSWTWYLLSQNPQCKERLHKEIDTVLNGRQPTLADLPNMPYLKMTVQEGMRLYPPVWGISRQTTEEVTIRGYKLPPKAILVIFPYVTHRHPDFWEQPDQFNPERFSPENSQGRPRFAYFPFGGGQRMCLGASFAMLETQLIVAMIMQQFEINVVPGHPVEPALYPSLRLKHGLAVTLRERQS